MHSHHPETIPETQQLPCLDPAWTGLRYQFAGLGPPRWLWWRIRVQLWFIELHQRTAQSAWINRLTTATALCILAVVWLSASSTWMQQGQPIQAALSPTHPLAWSTRSVAAQTSHSLATGTSSALGAESLALLGLPFLGTMQAHEDLSATRKAQWLTSHSGQLLALRLSD